jgi:hypothetical protein
MKFFNPEPNVQSQFAVGDRVSIIDTHEENPLEWAVFVIRDFFGNEYRLSPSNRHSTCDEYLWVSQEEIIKINSLV